MLYLETGLIEEQKSYSLKIKYESTNIGNNMTEENDTSLESDNLNANPSAAGAAANVIIK